MLASLGSIPGKGKYQIPNPIKVNYTMPKILLLWIRRNAYVLTVDGR